MTRYLRLAGRTAVSVLAIAVFLEGATIMNAAELPNDARRILYNSDSGNALSEFTKGIKDVERIKAVLAESIDEIADGGVDTFSVVFSTRFFSEIGPSKVLEAAWEHKGGWSQEGWRRLNEAGIDPRKVMAEQCHKHGMEFVACIRMNDRHGGPVGKIIRDNPDWQMKELSGGPAVDYAQGPVRKLLLAYIEELLGAVEVDGIDFDYLRWGHMFRPGEGPGNAHLLTDFTRKARKLLDEAAASRERRRLTLGVRVPQTFNECERLGYDVATWIKEGLVDNVIPSDFFHTDLNAEVGEFVRLTKGTNCRIYPSIHPLISRLNSEALMNLSNYRAAAHSFYAAGAAGLETYNYQYHWGKRMATGRPAPATMWPAALGHLRKLRDPKEIAGHDRHYLFHPIWPHPSQTGVAHDDRIRIDRAEETVQGRQVFRLFEDGTDPGFRAVLQFKVVGLHDKETLEIGLNGVAIPADRITRLFDGDGQNKWQGCELPAFFLYIVDLDHRLPAKVLVRGDNQLTIGIVDAEENAEGTVTIDELELYVYVKER